MTASERIREAREARPSHPEGTRKGSGIAPWQGCQHCGWQIGGELLAIGRAAAQARVAAHHETCPDYLTWRNAMLASVKTK